MNLWEVIFILLGFLTVLLFTLQYILKNIKTKIQMFKQFFVTVN